MENIQIKTIKFNPEKQREYCHKYYQKVKETEKYKTAVAVAKKIYYERNKEAIKERRREYYKKMKELKNEKNNI